MRPSGRLFVSAPLQLRLCCPVQHQIPRGCLCTRRSAPVCGIELCHGKVLTLCRLWFTCLVRSTMSRRKLIVACPFVLCVQRGQSRSTAACDCDVRVPAQQLAEDRVGLSWWVFTLVLFLPLDTPPKGIPSFVSADSVFSLRLQAKWLLPRVSTLQPCKQ